MYGAFSVQSGGITVTWDIEACGDGCRLHLDWTEANGPPVRLPRRQGFGSRLLERGLARQFGGEVHLTFSPEGLRCTMDLPLGSQDPQVRGELTGTR